MSSRLAYPYSRWINDARCLEWYNVPSFQTYNSNGCPRRQLMRLLSQCGNTHALWNSSSLLKCDNRYWFFSLPLHLIADWDTIGRSTRPWLSTWCKNIKWRNEQRSSILAISNNCREWKDDLIIALLGLRLFPSVRPRNLHAEELYITSFQMGYCLPTL